MKINFLKFGFYALMLSMGIFITACGSSEEGHDHDHDHQHEQHQHEQGEHDHDHEGHQHEQGQEDEGSEESSSIDKTGKEYTSAYICPMHCEGSGSDKEGTCPACKMAYIENPDK
jgi:ABC-type nickel/cobalt efflux system permease component RcnA